MEDEYYRPPHNRKMPIPANFNGETRTCKSEDELALDIVENLEASLEIFRAIIASLNVK